MADTEPPKGIFDRIFAALPSFAGRVAKQAPPRSDVPWVEPVLPLKDAVVALVSTGGAHLKQDIPFDIEDLDGDPSFREIPIATPRENLCISHDYYDQTDAEADLNLVLPIGRLRELQKEDVLGTLHGTAYSLMGHVADSHLATLQGETAPEISRGLVEAGVNYALLVPAGGSCNRTVAVVARAIEAAGIATVALSSAVAITAKAPPPRALYLRFPFGHALGEPGNRNQQLAVLFRAFTLLFEAETPGTIRDAGLQWKQERYFPPDWDRFQQLQPLPRGGSPQKDERVEHG
jgi:D-proline reductase (dithiol) PrdB